VEALARGRSYVGLDALAPARGFSFVAETQGGPGEPRRWTMGDVVPAQPGLALRAGGRLPRGARMTLLRGGRPVLEEDDGGVELAAPGPGVYRVEVRVPRWSVPWVLSNPIYVFDPPSCSTRSTLPRASRPSSTPRPRWTATSWRRGRGRTAAARLAFRLGAPGPGRPYTWCALVSRQPRDLSGRQGPVFWLRGDGVYRLWVQVRDENPASADEGTEWWFASVRTSPEWQRATLPFDRLRSINPKTDGRLDLDKVRQLVFVLDAGAVKPGTRGRIWFDEVGVY
jgi:hypothetical protein